jgi:hypothetical protein
MGRFGWLQLFIKAININMNIKIQLGLLGGQSCHSVRMKP